MTPSHEAERRKQELLATKATLLGKAIAAHLTPVHAARATHVPVQSWHYDAADAVDAIGMRENFVQYLCESADYASDIDAAKIIYGELIGNVVRHSPGSVEIDVSWTTEGKALLQVQDTGAPFEYSPQPPVPVDSETGRGLFLVNALADQFQIVHVGTGSVAVAVLPVTLAA